MKIPTQTMTAAVISIKKEANVKQKVNFVRNIVLSLFVLGALVFGTTQAMAHATCLTCAWPSGHECAQERDPDLYCMHMCVNVWDCDFGGQCHEGVGNSECRCFEKK